MISAVLARGRLVAEEPTTPNETLHCEHVLEGGHMREKGTYQWSFLQVLVLHYSQGDALISAVCFRWKTRNLVDVL